METFIWWVGVVEDRDDPEQLGRCRVRIFGYHTENKTLLPTKDLPWAIPMQPITSASISGVGTTPVGIVPGTWVTGWFLDGKDKQQPIIMGTIPGKTPARKEAKNKQKQDLIIKNALKDSTGKPIYENTGNLILKSEVETNTRNSFTPLTPTDLDILLLSIAKKVSSNNSSKIGNYGELGKYQLSLYNLINLGYLKRPNDGNINKNIINDSSLWTGLNGVFSKENFLANAFAQEDAMLQLTKSNYDKLISLDKIAEQDDVKVVAGFLASAHIFDASGSDDLERKDVYGRQAKEFFNLGVIALGGEAVTGIDTRYSEAENYLPIVDDGNITNEDLARVQGFSDPNKQYPKYEYEGFSDINKLAIGDRSHLSYKIKNAQKTENIQLARTEALWGEPEPSYSATYPYNQVIETEAGHVIELDSTPNAERIHVFHKTGTYIEIDVNGTMVRKVIGDNYEILDRNNFVYVKGANNLTVDGKTSIYVKDDAVIEVDGDVSVTGHKDALVQAAGTLAVSSKNLVLSGKQSVNIVSDGSINMQAARDINVNSKNNLSMQATGTISLKASVNLLMDALLVKTQMGANFIKDLVIRSFDLPESRNPNKTAIPPLQKTGHIPDSFLFDANEDGFLEWSNYREKEGQISNLIKVNYKPPRSGARVISRQDTVRVSCEICDEFGNSFPRSFKLSKNFTLGQLLVGKYAPPAVVSQKGVSAKEIVCNLMQLAENCLEPIYEKYPGMLISTGLRDASKPAPDGKSIAGGDHPIGAAADFQVKNARFEDYIDIANWCIKNIPFRQLILEYEQYKGTEILRAGWIHVALLLDKNGKIIPTRNPSVLTMLNHAVHTIGIISP